MILPKDLVAASATPIILAILHTRDTYGYAIIRKVQEISDNQIAWTDGMLYPVLHRLESIGYIDSYWNEAENGRKRKYYQITQAGKEEYKTLLHQWNIVQKALEVLFEEQQT